MMEDEKYGTQQPQTEQVNQHWKWAHRNNASIK